MKYNFDEVIERRGTDSVKYDAVSERWGRSDLLPMWVADMDFRTPPFVIEAIRRRLDHEVLGYTFACEAWYTSIINWQKERHGWNVTRFTPRRRMGCSAFCFSVSIVASTLPVALTRFTG